MNHPECDPRVVEKSPGFFPKRLLDLGSTNENGTIKLVTRIPGDKMLAASYATVSHCWGKAKTLKLLSNNIETLKNDGIDLDSLPISYKEAIHFATALDIRYLWIDSLCIIQDDPQDWFSEASVMDKVYLGCDICIALAGAAENSEPSFARRSHSQIRPIRITAEWDGSHVKDYTIRDGFMSRDYTSSVLAQRAWVVQESVMSHRTLSLGKIQAWYQCLENVACETYPGWIPKVLNPSIDHSNVLSKSDDLWQYRHKTWESTVERYSDAKLTYISDRLIAFRGITNFYSSRLEEQALAGLWRSQLPFQLLWRTLTSNTLDGREAGLDNDGPVRRPRPLRAPTWSWLSIEGRVQFYHTYTLGLAEEGSVTALCTVQHVQVDESLRDGQSYVVEGRITLQGALHPIRLGNDGRLAPPLTADANSTEFAYISASPSVQEHFGREGIPYLSAQWEPDEEGEQGGLEVFQRNKHTGPSDSTNKKIVEHVNAFCFPILEKRQEGFPLTAGLILEDSKMQPGLYERIGLYQTIGEEEKSYFAVSSLKLVTII